MILSTDTCRAIYLQTMWRGRRSQTTSIKFGQLVDMLWGRRSCSALNRLWFLKQSSRVLPLERKTVRNHASMTSSVTHGGTDIGQMHPLPNIQRYFKTHLLVIV